MNETVEILCPFCDKKAVRAIHRPSIRIRKVCRGSAKNKTTWVRTPEVYEVISDCSNCGKTVKEINKKLKDGDESQMSHEDMLKRIKEMGLPLKV